MKNVAFTGTGGKLGQACRKLFGEQIYYTRKDFDVRDHSRMEKRILLDRPTKLIHMAAVAGINQCELDKQLAYEVNTLATLKLAQIAHQAGVEHFVYISTACVFSGKTSEGIPVEETLPYPKHYYGLTKYIAEEKLKQLHTPGMQITIIRTNFAGMPWDYPKAFVDRFGTYLFADQVAIGIREILEECPTQQIIHVCGDVRMSMYEYALAGGSDVGKITLDEYSGPPLTIDMSMTSKYWKLYSLA